MIKISERYSTLVLLGLNETAETVIQEGKYHNLVLPVVWKIILSTIYLFFKSLLNLLQYCFCFMFFWFFWPRGMWDPSSVTRDQTRDQGSNPHPLHSQAKS